MKFYSKIYYLLFANLLLLSSLDTKHIEMQKSESNPIERTEIAIMDSFGTEIKGRYRRDKDCNKYENAIIETSKQAANKGVDIYFENQKANRIKNEAKEKQREELCCKFKKDIAIAKVEDCEKSYYNKVDFKKIQVMCTDWLWYNETCAHNLGGYLISNFFITVLFLQLIGFIVFS